MVIMSIKPYNGKDALKILENRQISLAILDVMMPDIDGLTLCETIKKKNIIFPL